MKKHLFSVCCTVLAIGSILSACTEGDPVYLEPEETQAAIELSSTDSQVSVNSGKTQATAIIGYAGGDIEITVASTLDSWSIQDVTDENERFTITQNKNVLKISAPENNSPDDSYSASVTVVTGKGGNKATALITVTQSSATPTIYCTIGDGGVAYDSENKILTIELENGSKILENIVITSNFGGWVFNEDIDGIDWITFEKDISWMVLHVSQNMGFTDISGTFTLTIGEGAQEETITVNVSQKKLPASVSISAATGTITIAEDRKSASNNDLSSLGGTFTFTISSTGDWTYTLSNTDAKANTASKSGSTLTYTVLPTDKKDQKRNLSVTITSGVEGNYGEATINITQRSFNEDYSTSGLHPMIIEVTTTTANQKVNLPLYGSINCNITWGDGSAAEHYGQTNPTVSANTAASHTYATPGKYSVTIDGVVTALDSQLSGVVGSFNYDTAITGVEKWGNTGLTSMQRAFMNCSSLKYLPEDDTDGAFKNVTTFYYGFRNSGLTSILKNTFKSAATEINCDFMYTFNGCASLTQIDGEMFATGTKITSFANTFQGCAALEAIPANLFANNNVTSFASTFAGCASIESIPENLFAHLTGIIDFSSTFSDCSGIESIPENIFANNTAAINFSYTFSGCSALESIPAALFANNQMANNFSGTFSSCSKVQSIPATLFENNTKVTTFANTFQNCPIIESIPENIFANNTLASNFSYTFSGCSKVQSIPENLFAPHSAVTTFANTFQNCSALESVPENIFASKPNVMTFTYTFAGCSALESIPATLFESNINATNFSYTFQNCTTLEEVPVGLFENNIKITSVNYLFAGCTGLTTIPTSIFDTNKGITNFSNTFSGCAAWTGESPYYSGVEPMIPLYKRAIGDEGGTTAIPAASYAYSNCFAGCSKLTDYASIPSAWGGGGQ